MNQRLFISILFAFHLTGCSQRPPDLGATAAQSVAASPRVLSLKGPLPKRKGHRKVGEPYVVNGRRYVPRHDPTYRETGIASWYGEDFHGRLTANGEVFDMHRLTAAHPTLPLPSRVKVTNLANGRSLTVRVNDRGPFVGSRIIDLSRGAARSLDLEKSGVGRVRVEFLSLARLEP